LYALASDDGDAIRALLASGRPYAQTAIDEVIRIVRHGGHVDRALEETDRHIELADVAAQAMGHDAVTPILRALGSYLVDRVAIAKSA
jgi:hypothetical protein